MQEFHRGDPIQGTPSQPRNTFCFPGSLTTGHHPSSPFPRAVPPVLPPSPLPEPSPGTFVEGLVDEVGGGVEVGAHVEGGGVVGLDAQVADAGALVVLGAAAPAAVRGVQHVGDAQLQQLPPVGRDISAGTAGRGRLRPGTVSQHGGKAALDKRFWLRELDDKNLMDF